MFQEEAEEKGSNITEEDSDSEEKWDCESILTTHTNTDNHPGIIKTERRVKPNQRHKIELHKQFKVPVDGLIPLAEEITIQKERRKADTSHPFQRVEGEGEEVTKGDSEEENPKDAMKELDPRKAHKQ